MISQLVPGKRPGRRRQAPGGFREHEAPRTQDLEFRAPERGRDVSEIEPPPGFTADELAEPVNADVGYPAYLSKSGTAGHTICYSRLFEVRELSVPVAKAGELRKFFRSIFADESMSALLKETRHQSRSATARVGVRRHCGGGYARPRRLAPATTPQLLVGRRVTRCRLHGPRTAAHVPLPTPPVHLPKTLVAGA